MQVLIAAVGALAAMPALGQVKVAPPPASMASYQGADRQQRLIEAARKEGSISLYHSSPIENITAFALAFEKKYGIKVRMWRSSSENILQRAVSEARAGRFEADIIETNSRELEALYREKLLQEVKSPHLADLIPQSIPPHREWIGTQVNIFAFAYNTRLIKKSEIPGTFADLLNPRWKGSLGIEASDFDWFGGVVNELGEARGLKLFRDIVAANGVSVHTGHTLLANLVVSGEVPMALTVYNYKAAQLKNDGAPIDWFVMAPGFARSVGVALLRRAQHPNGAVLFFDFMLSDAQEMFLKLDLIPTSKKIKTPLNDFPFKFIDPSVTLDHADKWNKIYADIILHQSR
jgi:iron(III) transport system substrate-binding protein